jgi:hypothetical protein
MAVIVETAMGQDLDLGTEATEKTHPGGGKVPGHQISLTTFSTAGASGMGVTQAWDPQDVLTASQTISNGSSAKTTVTVSGAALGDFALASYDKDLKGMTLRASVKSANTVEVVMANNSGAGQDPDSGNVKVLVFKVR